MTSSDDKRVFGAIGRALSRVDELRIAPPTLEQAHRLRTVHERLFTLQGLFVQAANYPGDDDFTLELKPGLEPELATLQEAAERVVKESDDLQDENSLERFTECMQQLIDLKQMR